MMAISWSSTAVAQPARRVTPAAKVQPVVVTPKPSTATVVSSEEPKSRPRRGTVPERERAQARSRIAAQLQVPVESLATPVVVSSVRRTKDPTALDVGMAIELAPSRLHVRFGTGGSVSLSVWSPRSISRDHIWLSWTGAGFWFDLTLPVTPTATPQTYTVECPVTAHKALPSKLGMRVHGTGFPAIEVTTPIVTTSSTSGWIFASVILPPSAHTTASISFNFPDDAKDADLVFGACELARLR